MLLFSKVTPSSSFFACENYSFEKIYSSDLLRAVQTAEIINTKHLKHQIYSELQEIDFGLLTGNTDEENNIRFKDFLAQRKELSEDLAFPGGECGRDVFLRAMPILDKIVSLFLFLLDLKFLLNICFKSIISL